MVIPKETNLKIVTGRKADVIMAAHLASEAALRLVKPGNENTDVTETTHKISEAFECKVSLVFILKIYYRMMIIFVVIS